jgi:hypothetical protein
MQITLILKKTEADIENLRKKYHMITTANGLKNREGMKAIRRNLFLTKRKDTTKKKVMNSKKGIESHQIEDSQSMMIEKMNLPEELQDIQRKAMINLTRGILQPRTNTKSKAS